MTVTSLDKGLMFASIIDNCRVIMIVFSWTSIAFASFEFFFTILAFVIIFAIEVTCIFYVGERTVLQFT